MALVSRFLLLLLVTWERPCALSEAQKSSKIDDKPSAESSLLENSAEVRIDARSESRDRSRAMPRKEEKGGRSFARQHQEKGEANENIIFFANKI